MTEHITGTHRATTARPEKVRENRLRRVAERRGLLLVRSRRRDRQAEDYGLYVLVEDTTGNRVGRYGGQAAISAFARGEGVTLDGIEAELLAQGERSILLSRLGHAVDAVVAEGPYAEDSHEGERVQSLAHRLHDAIERG